MSQYTTKPTPRFIYNLKKCIIYIKEKSQHIILSPINIPSLESMADSAYKRLDKHTRCGYTFRLREETDLINNKIDKNIYNNIFSWKSRKLNRLVDSSAAAELYAMKMAVKMSYKYINFIKNLWNISTLVYVHYTDNLPLIKILEKENFSEEPALTGEVRYIIQCLQETEAKVRWIDTNRMLADSLTKFKKM